MDTFIGRRGQQFGPWADYQVVEELLTGELSPDDVGWREGMAGWEPLRLLFPEVELPAPASASKAASGNGLWPEEWSRRMVAGGYLRLLGLMILPAPLALVASIRAIREIRRSRRAGQPKPGLGRAVSGLIGGLVGTLMILLAVAGAFALR